MSDLVNRDVRGWLSGQIQQTYLPRLDRGENLFALLFEAEDNFRSQGFDILRDLDFPTLFVKLVEERGFKPPDNIVSFKPRDTQT